MSYENSEGQNQGRVHFGTTIEKSPKKRRYGSYFHIFVTLF
jgi:hypothetical protein